MKVWLYLLVLSNKITYPSFFVKYDTWEAGDNIIRMIVFAAIFMNAAVCSNNPDCTRWGSCEQWASDNCDTHSHWSRINIEGLSITVVRFTGSSIHRHSFCFNMWKLHEKCNIRDRSPASDSFRLFNIVNVHDLPLCHYVHIRILTCSLQI